MTTPAKAGVVGRERRGDLLSVTTQHRKANQGQQHRHQAQRFAAVGGDDVGLGNGIGQATTHRAQGYRARAIDGVGEGTFLTQLEPLR